MVLALTVGCPADRAAGDGSSGGSADDSGDPSGTDPTGSSTNPSATADSTSMSTSSSASTSSSGDTSTDASPTDSTATGEDPPVGCYDYDAFAPSSVSYRADVMPILATWCSPCHADPSASIYFGTGGTSETEAVAVRDKLLAGVPKQAPELAFVAPGDPLHSYMMAKIEYPIPGGTCSVIQCSEPGCELPAPPAAPLSESDKSTVRSWIMLGAADD
jgi:hypothetical protein